MPNVVRIDLDEIEAALGSEVREFVLEVANELTNQLKIEAPVGATGDLRRSIQIQHVGESQVIVAVTARHALPVQTGTRPHRPPFEPIRIWARRVLGDQDAAGPVFHKIATEGTEANPFATRAVENTVQRFR